MNVEPHYLVFLAILIATLVSAILARRQRKQRRAVDSAQAIVVFGVAALTALASLFGLLWLVRQGGLEPGKWIRQAIEIASAVIAYFVAAGVLVKHNREKDNADDHDV